MARSRLFYEAWGFQFVACPLGPEPVAVLHHPAGIELNWIEATASATSRYAPVMDHTDIQGAAQFLLELRRQRRTAEQLPESLLPPSVEGAYAVQDALHAQAGWEIGGLKVGCTAPAGRDALGIEQSIAGRVPVEGCFPSGVRIERSWFARPPVVECELAFRLAADESQVEAVAPAFELVDPRLTGPKSANWIIADNSLATGIVVGEALPLERAGDLNAVKAKLRRGSKTLAEGSSAEVLDGPLAQVQWIVAHERSRGRSVPPGAWILTGTLTGLVPSEFGETYSADFGSLGSVEFSLGS